MTLRSRGERFRNHRNFRVGVAGVKKAKGVTCGRSGRQKIHRIRRHSPGGRNPSPRLVAEVGCVGDVWERANSGVDRAAMHTETSHKNFKCASPTETIRGQVVFQDISNRSPCEHRLSRSGGRGPRDERLRKDGASSRKPRGQPSLSHHHLRQAHQQKH